MPTHSRSAVVLSHLAFEDLGSLEAPLRQRGLDIETIQASTAHFPLPQTQSCELLVVLGGPIGVYQQQEYPFLSDEIACIGERLAAGKPTLGICLGAQLMAAALGARVYPGGKGAEIGWFPLRAAGGTQTPDWFAPLLEPGLSVFHWHGDTFDLPKGALLLAGTERYPHQAFAVSDFALGLQFHPEVNADDLESWYVGHACELHHAGIAVADLRSSSRKHSAALGLAAARFWDLWLDHVL
ncbi:MAG: glutamine amidotransferase [Terracidiphilus sp.]|nr:glutamine amidotransferase [Terracidiphilus sp.]